MKSIYLIITFGIIMLFYMSFVSADSIGVTKNYNTALQKYEIYQWFGLQKVADVHLISNTGQCISDCEAIIKLEPYINIQTSGNINDYDWQFLNVLKENQEIEYHLYNLVEWTEIIEIPKYECEEIEEISSNGTVTTRTECVIESYETEEIEKRAFQEIDFYDFEFQSGQEYILKLKGKKPVNHNIEWIPVFYSVTLDEWAWWSASWGYKFYINITETSGNDLVNYTFNRTIDTASLITAGKMQSDCDDLRVVENETTELNFNFTDCNTATTSVYFRGQLAENQVKNVSFYYGNAGASTGTSDWRDVYMEWDDFNYEGCDLTIWNNMTGTASRANGTVFYYIGNAGFNGYLSTKRNFTRHTGYEVYFRFSANIDANWQQMGIVSNHISVIAGAGAGDGMTIYSANDNLWRTSEYNKGTMGSITGISARTTYKWYNFSIRLNNTARFVDLLNGTIFTNSSIDGWGDSLYFEFSGYDADNTYFIDDFYVQRYVDSKPTFQNSTEEQATRIVSSLIVPADNTNVTSQPTNFTCNATISGAITLNNITLYIWNSSHQAVATNITTITGTFDETSWYVNFPYDDTFLWNCYAQDSTGGHTDWDTNRTVRYDSTAPTITINSPRTDDIFVDKTFNFNYSSSDTNPNTCWYNLNNGSGNTTLGNCGANTTITALENTNYTLDFYANDTSGNENSGSVDFTIVNLTMNEVHPDTAEEASSQNFGITIQKNAGVTALAWLWFNNTKYTSPDETTVGTNTTYNKSITMPMAASNPESKTSLWNFNLTYGTRTTPFNVTSYSINITQMEMNLDCVNTTVVLNYSFREELNNSQINGTSNIVLHFWKSTITLNRTTNFTSVENNTFIVCANGTYYVDSYLISTSYYNGKSYVSKSHRLLNATLNISSATYDYLYMLPSTDSTSILLHILDAGYMPLKNHYVKVQRYYVSENIYKTVEILKTDENGYAVAHLEEEDVDYKFVIQDYTTVLKTTSSMRIFCLESPCTLEIRVFEEENPYQYIMPDNLYINLSYTNDTRTISYEFTEATGLSKTGTLTVFSKGNRGDTLVCNTSTTTSSGTLNCDLSGRSEENFYGIAYWNGHFVENIWVSITSTFSTFGNEGVVFMIIIMTILAMVGIWNPIVSLVLMFAGFIFMLVTGIAYVVPAVVAAVAIIIILAIKYLNT